MSNVPSNLLCCDDNPTHVPLAADLHLAGKFHLSRFVHKNMTNSTDFKLEWFYLMANIQLWGWGVIGSLMVSTANSNAN